MKTAIIAPLLLAASTASAGCRWTQHGDDLKLDGDKRAHLVWEAAGGAGVALVNGWLDLGMSPTQQFGLTLLPGLVREIRTGCGRGHGGFSHQDMLYNAAGAALGVAAGNGVIMLHRNGFTIQWSLE